MYVWGATGRSRANTRLPTLPGGFAPGVTGLTGGGLVPSCTNQTEAILEAFPDLSIADIDEARRQLAVAS